MVRNHCRNTALRRFCFPIPILAPLACVMEAGAATPCDLVAERVGGAWLRRAPTFWLPIQGLEAITRGLRFRAGGRAAARRSPPRWSAAGWRW